MAAKDSSAKIAYDASLKMWDNVLWKGGNYSDGGIQQTIEINLVNKTINSLRQLNQYTSNFRGLYKDVRKKKLQESMAFQDFQDDIMTPPPFKTQ